jgi:hypothetical protein
MTTVLRFSPPDQKDHVSYKYMPSLGISRPSINCHTLDISNWVKFNQSWSYICNGAWFVKARPA